MFNQDIQFVIISADLNRKQLMQKQFKDFGLDLIFDIHYNEAITPNNSPYDLISVYPPFPESPETLCCFLSHVKAMKWYIENSKLPYLLLLEDDIALKKISFQEDLIKLLQYFNLNSFHYISIGYNPTNISKDLLRNPLIQCYNNLYWDLYKVYLHTTWGTQAQIFPRKTVEFFLSIYDKPSIKEICKSIVSYLSENKFYYINPPRLQIDSLNGLLQHQAIVCSPLVISYNNIPSLITAGDKQKNIWKSGHYSNLYKLNDYYSYNDDNLFLDRKTFRYKYFIMENIVKLASRFGSKACENFKLNKY